MFGEKYDEMRLAGYENVYIRPLLMTGEFIQPTVQIKITKENELETLLDFAEKNNWVTDALQLKRIMKPYVAVIVTDFNKSIIWVSSYFEKMTGYSSHEARNQNPGFLQGEETDVVTLKSISKKINQKKTFKGSLINYKKSGETYTCHVEIVPVFDSLGRHVHYIAFETDR